MLETVVNIFDFLYQIEFEVFSFLYSLSTKSEILKFFYLVLPLYMRVAGTPISCHLLLVWLNNHHSFESICYKCFLFSFSVIFIFLLLIIVFIVAKSFTRPIFISRCPAFFSCLFLIALWFSNTQIDLSSFFVLAEALTIVTIILWIDFFDLGQLSFN